MSRRCSRTFSGTPGVLAIREAWKDAVERGEGIFKDEKLGASGKACASCHKPGALRQVADAYPRFDPQLKRFVDINEAINRMVKEKVGGEPFPLNDQRLFDLVAYLREHLSRERGPPPPKGPGGSAAPRRRTR